jgi:hypothetical protein
MFVRPQRRKAKRVLVKFASGFEIVHPNHHAVNFAQYRHRVLYSRLACKASSTFRMRTTLSLLALFLVLAVVVFAASPSPDLLKLEKQVSLRIAHLRDQNLDESDLKKLNAAQNLDSQAEQALASGKYQQAESQLLRAKLLLHDLPQ